MDGTRVDSPSALRQALVSHSDEFVGTIIEKLLTYGLGRGLEFYDMPVVRSIRADASRNNNRFSSLIMGVVKSAPFQMKTKEASN
jgi:hypothetical protein